MTLRRGFRRIAWVLLALASPVLGFVSYQLSEHVAAYVPRLVDVGTAQERTSSRVAVVENLGVFYFPSYLSDTDLNARIKAVIEQAKGLSLAGADARQSIAEFAHAIRAKYPEYSDLGDTDLVSRVVAKYPEYRPAVNFRAFEVDEVREKRPLWALVATAGALVAMAGALFGTIAVVGWIADGFNEVRKPAVS